MRVCVVGKYPPIQGGISAQCYWMCRWLAECGHTVDVVTNADEVEDAYRIQLADDDAGWLEPRFGEGGVTVHWTARPTAAYRYIPSGNPVVTKLASLAANAIERSDADVVLGFYLEPYALAAHLAARWTGRPLVVRHAGSDVGRLLDVAQLQRAYTEVFKAADVVCARPASRGRLLELGVSPAALVDDPGFVVPRDLFDPRTPALDVAAFLADVPRRYPAYAAAHPAWQTAPLDPARPIVGIYGKLGSIKGTYDLVAALGRLKTEGVAFTLLAAAHGPPAEEARFEDAIVRAGLRDDVRILPFLPHWRVPPLLRACAVVCSLENRFPIVSHAPGLAAEVLACAVPLVLSAEIARKQVFAARLVHGHNAFVVRDPADVEELRQVLRTALADPAALRALGERGARVLPDAVPPAEQARAYEDVLAQACSARHGTGPAERDSAGSADRVDADEDQETTAWHALHAPHPALATNALLDELFFRGHGLDWEAELAPDLVPALAGNVVIRPFSHGMDDGGGTPAAYAFQHLPLRTRNRVVRLGAAQYVLSTLVDGRRGVAAIAAAFADATLQDTPAERAACGKRVRRALLDLFAEGIITVSPARDGVTVSPVPTPERNTHDPIHAV
jgi:glycosyltransferase involved in cell wall biosynthesis